MLRRYLLLSWVLLVSACATLSEDECRVADWQIIGFEDGSRGYHPQRLGEHREACAEYGIRPDMDRYMTGHREGLLHYCTYNNGYALGRRGGQYGNVCPPETEQVFIEGFNRGRALYQQEQRISRLDKQIQGLETDIEQFQLEMEDNEHLIISDEATPRERSELLWRNHELSHLIEENLAELEQLRLDRDEQVHRLREMQAH